MRRMPRDDSICTHDIANGMSDSANTGAASRCCVTIVYVRTTEREQASNNVNTGPALTLVAGNFS